MSIKILKNNAKEAWSLTLNFCEKILDGMPTLQTKKMFVSNLHNMVELTLKQIMINNNDIRIISNFDATIIEKIKEIYEFDITEAEIDLNKHFFINQDRKFKSIEFKKMIGIIKDILPNPISREMTNFDEWRKSFLSNIGKINEIRNCEMHFDINEKLLDEITFIKMLALINQIEELAFSKTYNVFGTHPPFGERNSFFFGDDFEPFSSREFLFSSFENSIIESETNKAIAKTFNYQPHEVLDKSLKDVFAEEISALSIPAGEFYARLNIMEEYNLVQGKAEINGEYEVEECDGSTHFEDSIYKYIEFDERLLI